MRFEVIPVVERMHALYQQPRTIERFQEYIRMLEGGRKGDMALPISGFNPMAKAHLPARLEELMAMGAEDIMADIAAKVNERVPEDDGRVVQLVLNVADDMLGGWTNRYTTDYASRFQINALVERGFCAPYFWSSEEYTRELIAARTLAYAYRTIHHIRNGRARTLADCVAQEVFVAAECGTHATVMRERMEAMRRFYEVHQLTEDYNIIFNFFYGNEVCRELGYPVFGLPDGCDGFGYAACLGGG